MALFADIIKGIRSMSYDRFPTPLMYTKRANSSDWKVEVSPTAISVKEIVSGAVKLNVALPNTGEVLLDSFLSNSNMFSVATSFAFNGSDGLKDLMPLNKPLSGVATIYRKYFFSEESVLSLINDYFVRYRKISCSCVNTANITQLLTDLPCGMDRHLILWVSYYLVERRRVAESANTSFETTFTNDESLCVGLPTFQSPTSEFNISVTVGDVFSLSDTDKTSYTEEINRIGAENLFGDNSFWWKYQMYLRILIERQFGDYSLRPNQMMVTQLTLEKDHLLNAYYENYPYTFWEDSARVLPQCN
jgi:hypothetical protein